MLFSETVVGFMAFVMARAAVVAAGTVVLAKMLLAIPVPVMVAVLVMLWPVPSGA